MRLMYVLPAEAFGGAERQGVFHIRRLRQLGIELEAVVGPGTPIQHALQDYGVHDFRYCDLFPRATHSDMGLAGNLHYAASYARAFLNVSARLVEIGREADTQLIFAARSFGWAVAARAAHSLKIPYIVRAGSRPTRRGQLAAIRIMCARYGPPAALLSNCRAVHQMLIGAFRCPGAIVPNAVDTERFDARRCIPDVRLQLKLGSRPVVGLAARPAPGKGIEILADVVRLVAQKIPSVVFIIAGEFGWRGHYQDMMLKMGLQEKVRFLGHLDDIRGFFTSCDAVILTSSANSIEGSPNALLEAMSMARPVVASNIGGIPEIIRDGVEGFLADPESPSTFANRLIDLLQDEKLRLRMGRDGRRRILQHYSEDKAMQALVHALYRFAPNHQLPAATTTRIAAGPESDHETRNQIAHPRR